MINPSQIFIPSVSFSPFNIYSSSIHHIGSKQTTIQYNTKTRKASTDFRQIEQASNVTSLQGQSRKFEQKINVCGPRGPRFCSSVSYGGNGNKSMQTHCSGPGGYPCILLPGILVGRCVRSAIHLQGCSWYTIIYRSFVWILKHRIQGVNGVPMPMFYIIPICQYFIF